MESSIDKNDQNNEKLDDPFLNVQLFIKKRKISGTVYFTKYALTFAILFVEEGTNVTDKNSFGSDPFSLNPLTSPYLCSNGYHILDLSFFSQFSQITKPYYRLCFNDPNQENNFSLNFQTGEDLVAFLQNMKREVTIKSISLGFYSITTFHPQYLCDSFSTDFVPTKNLDTEMIFSKQSILLQEICPDMNQTMQPKNPDFTSRENIYKHLQNFSVPDESKADVWAYLIGLSPLESLKSERIQQYLGIRQQFQSITFSEYQRSTNLRENIENLKKEIYQNHQSLISIIKDDYVDVISFNVIMSICTLFDSLHKHHNELLMILKVFLWTFVKGIKKEKNKNSKISFHIKQGLLFNSDQLETVLFWSLLFILEKGELRTLLGKIDSHQPVCNEIKDTLAFLHPLFFSLLMNKGYQDFEVLAPLLTKQLSSFLSLCDCADIWLAAASCSSWSTFMQMIIVASLLFDFPNFINSTSGNLNLYSIIGQAFELMKKHAIIEGAAFKLCEKMESMVKLDDF